MKLKNFCLICLAVLAAGCRYEPPTPPGPTWTDIIISENSAWTEGRCYYRGPLRLGKQQLQFFVKKISTSYDGLNVEFLLLPKSEALDKSDRFTVLDAGERPMTMIPYTSVGEFGGPGILIPYYPKGSICILDNYADVKIKISMVPGDEETPADDLIRIEGPAEVLLGESRLFLANSRRIVPEGETLVWTVDDPDVAEIRDDGILIGKKPGNATVSVRYSDKTETAAMAVTVRRSTVTGITLSDDSCRLEPGKTKRLYVRASSGDSKRLSYEWTSSNPEVFSVNQDGEIRAVGQGRASLTVKSPILNLEASAEVVVSKRITSLKIITPEKTSLPTGKAVQMTAEYEPSDAFSPDLTWTSHYDDSSYSNGLISKEGLMNPKNPGNFRIRVSSANSNASDELNIKIFEALRELKLHLPDNLVMTTGEGRDLGFSIIPEDAQIGSTVYESSNPDVAEIIIESDARQIVLAKNPGTAEISITAPDEKISDKIFITVEKEKDLP